MGRVRFLLARLRKTAGWWGACLGCSAILAVFLQGSHQQSLELEELEVRKSELLSKADDLREQQDELQRQLKAQTSAAWVELRLVEKLGVVPRGSFKVIFVEGP